MNNRATRKVIAWVAMAKNNEWFELLISWLVISPLRFMYKSHLETVYFGLKCKLSLTSSTRRRRHTSNIWKKKYFAHFGFTKYHLGMKHNPYHHEMRRIFLSFVQLVSTLAQSNTFEVGMRLEMGIK